VAGKLKDIVSKNGRDSVAALATPNSTVEELFLLRKLMAGLGVEAVETRLRASDFSLQTAGATWLGQSIAELAQNESVLLIGSVLRKEQPLLAQRLRQSVKKGMKLSVLNPLRADFLTTLAGEQIVRPDQMVEGVLSVIKAVLETQGKAAPAGVDLTGVEVTEAARKIAACLSGKSAVLLGNLACNNPRYAELHAAAAALAELVGSQLGVISAAANSVGAQLVGAEVGGNVFAEPKKAYFLLNAEVQFDCHNAGQALAAVEAADFVVALNPFVDGVEDYADVVLPIAPFTETSGTFVNMEGRAQSFNGVVRPLGEARPAWKVLRVLGNVLNLNGFEYETSEQIRDEALAGEIAPRLGNALKTPVLVKAQAASGLVRLGDVPLYQQDAITRRAHSLQATVDAAAPVFKANAATLVKLGLAESAEATVDQGSGEVVLTVAVDQGLADDVIRIAAGHSQTASLGGLFAALTVLK